jgi:DNA end-binding protein Ku
MRAIWSGSIGFGLVNIPVKLYSAVQGSEVALDLLDKGDHANIKFQRVNANTGKVVPWENIVKGYKINDHYVIVTQEDFEKASPEKSKIIEITEFVEGLQIDSIYYETPYYLEPEKSGVKAYALLREALKKTNKVGIGSYVLRNREHLVVLKPINNLIVLNRIRFAKEIKNPNEIEVPAGKSTAAEMKMAIQLIEQLSGSFDISKYKDTYSEKLLKLVSAKDKGKKILASPLRVVHSRSRDLMSQLKASLGTAKRRAS